MKIEAIYFKTISLRMLTLCLLKFTRNLVNTMWTRDFVSYKQNTKKKEI